MESKYNENISFIDEVNICFKGYVPNIVFYPGHFLSPNFLCRHTNFKQGESHICFISA